MWVRLEKVTVGLLRVPVGWVEAAMKSGAARVSAEVGRWRVDARLDERGRGNSAMVLASGGRLLVGVLRGEGVEGAGFLPMDDRRGLGVKVVGVAVEGEGAEGVLRLRLRVVGKADRTGLGGRVKGVR